MQVDNHYTNINIFKKTYEDKVVSNYKEPIEQSISQLGTTEHKGQFNPYVNNQGTTLGKLNHGLLTKK